MKIEAVGVVGEDMMDGLSFLNERADQGVKAEKFVFGNVGPAPRLDQDVAGFVLAAIAKHREFVRASRKHPPGSLDRCGCIANRMHTAGGIRLVHAQLSSVAVCTANASVGDPTQRALVTGDAPGKDLPRQSRMMLVELDGDLLERSALPERVLNLQTFEFGEVPILHL